MHKTTTILFIFLLPFVTPVYAVDNFKYSRLIETDNSRAYKSVVLDKAVYAHSDHLNDLRVINDKGEEVPYLLASIRDASTETEKESFILSEEVQYVSTQAGTDSVITIQVNHLNAFRLEINTEDRIERTYGLYGIKDESTHYLSDGQISNLLPSDPSVKRTLEWTNNPPIDKLKLIIHNRNGEPLNPKSITVKYYLNKLVFNDPGYSQVRLVYSNDTLRSPIYEVLNYKAIIKSENVIQTELGAEVITPSIADTPQNTTKYKILSKSTLTALVLLLILGMGLCLRKKNK